MTESETVVRSQTKSESTGPASSPDRILDAAIRNFLQFGYEGTSITKIAKAAGMTAANIYWHFPSKLDLLFVSLQSLYRSSYLEIARAVGNGSAQQRLREYTRAFVLGQLSHTGTENNFGYASLSSSLTREQQEELLSGGRPYIDLLKEILRQGTDEGVFHIQNLTVTAHAISTMCEYAFTWYHHSGPLTANEVADQYADIVVSIAVGKVDSDTPVV